RSRSLGLHQGQIGLKFLNRCHPAFLLVRPPCGWVSLFLMRLPTPIFIGLATRPRRQRQQILHPINHDRCNETTVTERDKNLPLDEVLGGTVTVAVPLEAAAPGPHVPDAFVDDWHRHTSRAHTSRTSCCTPMWLHTRRRGVSIINTQRTILMDVRDDTDTLPLRPCRATYDITRLELGSGRLIHLKEMVGGGEKHDIDQVCPLKADSPITHIQDRGLGVAVKELALPLAANSDLGHHTTSKLVGTPTCWPVDSDSESTDSMFSIATAVTSDGVVCGVNPVYSQNLSMARWASARRCPAALAAM